MFQFKQFSVNQDRTAMKVGTDGVLLGAWATIAHEPYSILDIGTGTGLIALMLAQRSGAGNIEALEIDADAYEQAVDNFEESPWNDRLFCFHASLDAFMDEVTNDANEGEPPLEYDLIVCNPPFYAETVSSGNDSRDRARQILSLPFAELVEAARILLSERGILCVILPYKEERGFLDLAEAAGLHAQKITRVKGNPQTETKRSLLALSRSRNSPRIDELIIETGRHQYTAEYRELTKDFYLDKPGS